MPGSAGASATSTCRSTATASPAGRSSAARVQGCLGVIRLSQTELGERPAGFRAAFGIADDESAPTPGADPDRRATRLPAGSEFPRHLRLVYLAALLADAAADARPGRGARSSRGTFEFGRRRTLTISMATSRRRRSSKRSTSSSKTWISRAGMSDTRRRGPRKSPPGCSPTTRWQEQFKKRFVVLPDTAFDFLCETGTEVHTRVRIDDELKSVAKGASVDRGIAARRDDPVRDRPMRSGFRT